MLVPVLPIPREFRPGTEGESLDLVLRESLDVPLHHLLPWDIELVIDEPEPEPKVCEKV